MYVYAHRYVQIYIHTHANIICILKQVTKVMILTFLTFLSLLPWLSKNNGSIYSFSICFNILVIENLWLLKFWNNLPLIILFKLLLYKSNYQKTFSIYLKVTSAFIFYGFWAIYVGTFLFNLLIFVFIHFLLSSFYVSHVPETVLYSQWTKESKIPGLIEFILSKMRDKIKITYTNFLAY